jgi:hypothetical protein
MPTAPTNAVFGLVARPANNNCGLADLRLSKGAVKSTYPDSKGSPGYLELNCKP